MQLVTERLELSTFAFTSDIYQDGNISTTL